MTTSLMERITEYFAACPLVDGTLPFFLDFVGKDNCYCISSEPNTTYRKDIVGNKIYTVSFQFSLRAKISADTERAENIAFLERFNKWVDEQNEARSFPQLAANEVGISLKVIESGYLYDGDDDHCTGIYLTQLQFIYKEKKLWLSQEQAQYSANSRYCSLKSTVSGIPSERITTLSTAQETTQ